MNIEFVGCRFVVDYYASSLPDDPELQLQGVFDRESDRASKFAKHWNIPLVYPSFEAVLSAHRAGLVFNLSNHRSHYEITKASLMTGKHVYSDKPLTINFSNADGLENLTDELYISIYQPHVMSLGNQLKCHGQNEFPF